MKKNIIVTGGAQGIGKITVRKLLSENYAVTVFDNDKEAIEELQTEHPVQDISSFQLDVSDENAVKSAIRKTHKHFGNVFGLVNNAAIHANKPITELTLDEWNKVLGTNLTGAFICTKHASPYLKASNGRIINIASTRAFQSEANTEAYSASKGGILALTHALATSLGPEIKVNAISPGWIDVSSIKKKKFAKQEKLSDLDHQQHLAGRVGKPEDIANLVLFLFQEENDFITAQNFIVDGGMTRKMIYV